jgi:DNA-3-methyladenine glycosylase I
VSDKAPAARPHNDDGYFEELTKSLFEGEGGLSWQVVEAKWPGFRRAFSNFSVRDVADYTPDDVDRLMSDPAITKNLQKIEATIENAGEMMLVQMEHGSFGEYLESFATLEEAAEDVASRFRWLGPAAAAAFVKRVSGPVAV